MARANNGGWDFVTVGKSYQYKEDWFIAIVTVLEDRSDEKYYRFLLRIDKATDMADDDRSEFVLEHVKNLDGYYSGMSQLYEGEEYFCTYKWFNSVTGDERSVATTA